MPTPSPPPSPPRLAPRPPPAAPPAAPPSPSTAAAAMSLGALAAAATLAAAAAAPPPQPRPYPLPYLRDAPPPPPPYPLAQPPHPHPQHPAPPRPVAPRAPHASAVQQSPAQHPAKPKQRRYRATPEQLRQLISRFDVNPSPSSAELQELAASIAMPPQSVVLWFKNRRARVPHKKAEKALAAKRREAAAAAARTDPPAAVSAASPKEGPAELPADPTLVAAASMAEMAMALAARPALQPQRQAGRNITNQASRAASFPPTRSPSRSPPPLYRPRPENVVPYDTNLAKRLSARAAPGAEFVDPAAAGVTPRRPRLVPPTPRLFSQREYHTGDRVEVLETAKGICRSWYSATVVSRAGPKELSLGASAAAAFGLSSKTTALKPDAMGTSAVATGAASISTPVKQEVKGDVTEGGDAGGDSPRTVRSPAASPTPPIAKVMYTVEYEHRSVEGESSRRLREDVAASRIRPEAPGVRVGTSAEEWRPEAGEAVEVLRDGAWFVAVMQNFVVRKGYMVSFESGDAEWVRRPRIRPYQIWRGGDSWVTKMKPPLPVVRKSVGLSVTHPPGGKRKRGSGDVGISAGGKDSRETRGRGKRARSMSVDRSGPDGLPEGWRVGYLKAGMGVFYVAPDGHRLRSLKEAQRYVKMMGPA